MCQQTSVNKDRPALSGMVNDRGRESPKAGRTQASGLEGLIDAFAKSVARAQTHGQLLTFFTKPNNSTALKISVKVYDRNDYLS
jgi:hypothetical protein